MSEEIKVTKEFIERLDRFLELVDIPKYGDENDLLINSLFEYLNEFIEEIFENGEISFEENGGRMKNEEKYLSKFITWLTVEKGVNLELQTEYSKKNTGLYLTVRLWQKYIEAFVDENPYTMELKMRNYDNKEPISLEKATELGERLKN